MLNEEQLAEVFAGDREAGSDEPDVSAFAPHLLGVSRCPLCGAHRETHACSTVPPMAYMDEAPSFDPEMLRRTAIDVPRERVVFVSVPLRAHFVDPNRRGGSW